MAGKALGMIEVKGLLGSIIAADIALKTADVHLIANQTINGGLTSVELFGSVGAIKESVQAAREVVSKMGCFISSNIIANLDPQVEEMILASLAKNKTKQTSYARRKQEKQLEQTAVTKKRDKDLAGQETSDVADKIAIENEIVDDINEVIAEVSVTEELETDAEKVAVDVIALLNEYGISSLAELTALKVTQLRSIAYAMNLLSLTKKEIKFAKKADLIQAIVEEGAD